MKNLNDQIPIYELSVNIRMSWQAHSLSNSGNNGTNRMLPRRQLLADGTETDACSGSIAKRYHAALLTEQMMAKGIHLCSECAAGDSRRAGANDSKDLDMSSILTCGVCDTHGFLITGKKAKKVSKKEGGAETKKKGIDRDRLSKHSLIEFSFALALPEQMSESLHLFTRQASGSDNLSGNDNGQMLFKKNVRSGSYAQCVRYKAAGIGVNTEIWETIITDPKERLLRHQAILIALRDQLQSPGGAMTSTLLPHLTEIQGVIAIKTIAGRAPLYSPLMNDFVVQLQELASDSCLIFQFNNLSEFHILFQRLLDKSFPVQPMIEMIPSIEVTS